MRKGVVLHHNGLPAKCVGKSHDRCVSFWSGVRRWHMEGNGWSDIAYSFGVCPHGHLFTGRGWYKSQFANGADQVGANDGRDSDWYTVLAFVGGGKHGGFDTGAPEERVTPEMTAAIADLISKGRAWGYCGDRVLPHNRFKKKACPGPTLTALAARLDGAPTTSHSIESDDDMTPAQAQQLDAIHMLATAAANDAAKAASLVVETHMLATAAADDSAKAVKLAEAIAKKVGVEK